MPLDPEATAALEAQAAMGGPSEHEVSPEEARAMVEAQPRIPGPEVASVSNHLAPGIHGDIPVRVYVPTTDEAGSLPVCVWFHGGGWVVGSLDTTDATCRALANAAGAVVVSVDYRLAPEHPFPIPLDDCYAATEWAAANAASLGGDPSRLAVAGSSSGGNLAAAVALRTRDEGGPRLAHQSLICPALDNDFERPSYVAYADSYGPPLAMMSYFWQCYVPNEADARNLYAVPVAVPDLAGLPSAFVLTCEYDPLRDEGEAYAERLREAGVPTKLSRYDGMLHSLFDAGAPFKRTWDAIDEVGGELRKAFGTA